MCGIVCALVPKDMSHHGVVSEVQRGVDVLHHRGPHGAGIKIIELPWATVIMGGVRLEIVGGADIQVPFFDRATGVTIAYNGEVYNWKELRRELSNGDPWETECDTEFVDARPAQRDVRFCARG